MSTGAIHWTWGQNISPGTLKLLTLAFAELANHETHLCYPSGKKLEQMTGLNRKTVIDGIQKMLDAGLLEETEWRVGRTNQVKVYRFTYREPKGPEIGTVPKSGPLSNEPVFTRKSPDFTMKESRNRDTEPSNRNLVELDRDSPPLSPKGDRNLFGEHESLPEVDPDDQLVDHVLSGWRTLSDRFKGISALEVLTAARRKKLLARSNEVAKSTGLTREQIWDRIFEKIPRNVWLRGDAPAGRGRTSSFKLSIDFVLRQEQFTRIFEGGYDGRQSDTFDEQLGRDLSPVELADREIAAKLHAAEERASRRGADQAKYHRLPPPAYP